MKNIKYFLFLPGSVSLFVLLQFLTETFAEDRATARKISNSWILFSVDADPGSDLRRMQMDLQHQFTILLVVTLLFLVPPVIWVVFEAVRTARKNEKGTPDGEQGRPVTS